SFLYLEDELTPMHVGGVAIFRRPRSGFSYEAMAELIERRLSLVPRYRQKVLSVPGNLARPVWVDDPEFDLTYHMRRSALPQPGTDAQLHDLVARLMSRRLDRSRPLWEAYYVEGLAGSHVALVTKTHPALVDGVRTIDLGQLILEPSPEDPEGGDDDWAPRRLPSQTQLIVDAVSESVSRPAAVADNIRQAATDAAATARKAAGVAGGVVPG